MYSGAVRSFLNDLSTSQRGQNNLDLDHSMMLRLSNHFALHHLRLLTLEWSEGLLKIPNTLKASTWAGWMATWAYVFCILSLVWPFFGMSKFFRTVYLSLPCLIQFGLIDDVCCLKKPLALGNENFSVNLSDRFFFLIECARPWTTLRDELGHSRVG